MFSTLDAPEEEEEQQQLPSASRLYLLTGYLVVSYTATDNEVFRPSP